ncbi:hypothetical protein O181_104899 [Austropuccinia psidii MF-1]|uniref:Uncharacterized protein n=1 Tax=Austropuccinia psidii MF-1 TaxID=1389203 RepID=A0A9Q3JNC8_9BASI|nr:hypothetical protein [Austropuccinia psidii MF-1]
MSASRQRQSSHVSHENFTQRPNPFQHYFQHSGIFTSLASASLRLSMLMSPHHPPDETPTLPPPSPSSPLLMLAHPHPYCPYACVVPSLHASNTAYHPYARKVPSQHAPDTAYHPYAWGMPSQHAANTAYHPYAHGVPSRHAADTAYHPYACVVRSRHASDTAYHPYACGVPSRHAPNFQGVTGALGQKYKSGLPLSNQGTHLEDSKRIKNKNNRK